MTTAAQLRTNQQSSPEASRLRVGLLGCWLLAAFGGVYFARSMSWVVVGWPFSFWYASQGAVLMFVGIVAVYAWRRNKSSLDVSTHTWEAVAYAAYKLRLHRIMSLYIAGVLSFLGIMFAAERAGLPRYWLGGICLTVPVGPLRCLAMMTSATPGSLESSLV